MVSRFSKRRTKKGVSLIEAILAAMILIPIALLVLDLMVLVAANSMNDTACKNAARAGGNQPNGNAASQAAEKVLATFTKSGIVKSLTIDDVIYNESKGTCTVTTIMAVNLPVPFPGFSQLTFNGRAVEPIVGTANPNPP